MTGTPTAAIPLKGMNPLSWHSQRPLHPFGIKPRKTRDFACSAWYGCAGMSRCLVVPAPAASPPHVPSAMQRPGMHHTALAIVVRTRTVTLPPTPTAQRPSFGLPLPGVLRQMVIGACMLEWIPVVIVTARTPWETGAAAVLSAVAFFAGALFAGIVAWLGKPFARHAALASAVATWVALVMATALPSPTTTAIALGLTGLAWGAALELWMRHEAGLSIRKHSAMVLAILLPSTIVLVGCSACPTWISYAAAAAGCTVQLLVGLLPGNTQQPSAPPASADIRDSKAFRLASMRLQRRCLASFFLLATVTGAMTTMFALGIPTPPEMDGTLCAPLGSAVFALLVGAGWLRNREPDPLFSFALSLLVAVIVFFPFYPGTRFNQHLSLALAAV